MITLESALRKQPHLRLVNINNISERLLSRTSGSCFIAYNVFNGQYELHSLLSFDENCNTCNAVIEKSWLNWRIIEDYLMHNHRKFGQELADEREYMCHYYDESETKRQFERTSDQIEIIKRTLGRRV